MDFRDKWLKGLGERLSIPTLAFDEEGICQLRIDHKMVVIIYKTAEAESLLISGQLDVSHFSPHVMRRILVEGDHHLNLNIPSPVLSVSENLDKIQIRFELTQSELVVCENVIDRILYTLENWQKHLNIT